MQSETEERPRAVQHRDEPGQIPRLNGVFPDLQILDGKGVFVSLRGSNNRYINNIAVFVQVFDNKVILVIGLAWWLLISIEGSMLPRSA